MVLTAPAQPSGTQLCSKCQLQHLQISSSSLAAGNPLDLPFASCNCGMDTESQHNCRMCWARRCSCKGYPHRLRAAAGSVKTQQRTSVVMLLLLRTPLFPLGQIRAANNQADCSCQSTHIAGQERTDVYKCYRDRWPHYGTAPTALQDHCPSQTSHVMGNVRAFLSPVLPGLLSLSLAPSCSLFHVTLCRYSEKFKQDLNNCVQLGHTS